MGERAVVNVNEDEEKVFVALFRAAVKMQLVLEAACRCGNSGGGDCSYCTAQDDFDGWCNENLTVIGNLDENPRWRKK